MPDLDAQLARSRDDLFDEITQPPLATVQRRAGALRRRKVAVRSGAAAVALAGLAFAVVPGVTGDGPPPVAAPSVAPTGTVYRDDGITINGLVGSPLPLQLEGTLADVEFVDQTTGYVLTECADGCRAGERDGMTPCRFERERALHHFGEGALNQLRPPLGRQLHNRGHVVSG